MGNKPYLVMREGSILRAFSDLDGAVAFTHEFSRRKPDASVVVVHSAGLTFAPPLKSGARLKQWLRRLLGKH